GPSQREKMSHLGSAFLRPFLPASVTLVRLTSSTRSPLSPSSCLRPASVTRVLDRPSPCSPLRPARCSSPPSVTLVWSRYSRWSPLRRARCFRPVSLTPVSSRYSTCKPLRPASCFRPASVTWGAAQDQRPQALEVGQVPQRAVRHLAPAQPDRDDRLA